jgi:hypothetical protein
VWLTGLLKCHIRDREDFFELISQITYVQKEVFAILCCGEASGVAGVTPTTGEAPGV